MESSAGVPTTPLPYGSGTMNRGAFAMKNIFTVAILLLPLPAFADTHIAYTDATGTVTLA